MGQQIKLKIPEGLSKQEEILLLASKLNQKLIPSKKQIGEGFEVVNSDTTIIIERVTLAKDLVTKECSCCGVWFDISMGHKLEHNYGGKKKISLYCSSECRNFAYDLIGQNRGRKILKRRSKILKRKKNK